MEFFHSRGKIIGIILKKKGIYLSSLKKMCNAREYFREYFRLDKILLVKISNFVLRSNFKVDDNYNLGGKLI